MKNLTGKIKHAAPGKCPRWLMGSVFYLMGSGLAIAAEEPGAWRATYDTVMMWVNFLILAFLVVKFAGPLLKNFLKDRQDEVALEIDHLERERDRLLQQIEQTVKEMGESRAHFQALKERIVAQGEAQRQSIVEEARRQSKTMLDDAHRRVENQIVMAKQDFRAELIDAAVELAMKNIGRHITAEDNERLLQEFMVAVGQ